MEESWERNHGRGILGGTMAEETRQGNHGREIMGEESWERNHEMEAPRRHPAGTSAKQRQPRGSQKAPRRHPGGTQEAPRRHPGHPGVFRRSLEEKGDKTIVFYHRKRRDRPFRVHETSATPTKHRKNAVEHRWTAAGDKWRMATGKGRNLEETIGKAARYKV